MDNIPTHLRITGLAPSNEDVDARRAAVSELAAAWGKIDDIDDILQKSARIAESLSGDGHPDAELGKEVEVAVQNHASAFLYEESPLEVGVCAGMAAVSMLKPAPTTSGWAILDFYSNALWSALAFQPPLVDGKREKLRREVFGRARERSIESANKARDRDQVPDVSDLTVTIGDDGKAATNFKKAMLNTIGALRRNAALDREELDFMWWVQMNRSRRLDRALSSIPEATRLVAAGIEAADHLRRLPADVHRDLVLRTVGVDPELDLRELLEVISEDRKTLGLQFVGGSVAANPLVFPLLHALATGSVDAPGAEVKRRASTWGGRALLEAGLCKISGTGQPEL